MLTAARPASESDLPELVRLYRLLEAEQGALKSLWPVADGLPEPVEIAFKDLLVDPQSVVVIGTIDEVPVGFLWMRVEELLPQAEGTQIGVARLIYVEEEARGVSVGEEMISRVMEDFRERGINLFDANVSPGHRLAKNFFESHGYSARRIVMHHSENATWQ
ncbi:MAG: GNAT family N-acetyltransferase [Acidimicrobiia bacterium]|nr:GNAT family N-acetyltransferase [Acidimicrobiia bacterium]